MAQNQSRKFESSKAQDEAHIEKQFLESANDPGSGACRDLFAAKTRFEGQDGGAVSALLIKGFEEGLFDVAIVVRRGIGYSAEVVVATNAQEVLAAKGTRYLKVNVTKTLRELINQGKKRLAIVCTPCEGKAARKIQQVAKDYEITIIGLFCFEAFDSAKIRKEVKCTLGIDLDDAEKTQVRQGKFSAFVDGREYSCKVKELHLATEKVCGFCSDFTAEYADISVGSVGSKKGYSTVIVRTEAGEKLIRNLEATKGLVDTDEIARLAKFKRERAQRNLAEVNKAE
jgi:coenzyme F420-reducing hydrogenase beta subunit